MKVKVDKILLTAIIILSIFGIVMIYSASSLFKIPDNILFNRIYHNDDSFKNRL